MPDTPPRLFRLLVPVGAVLAVAGVGAFYWASQQRGDALPEAEMHPVTVTAQACEPMEITVPAGQRSFKITNSSDRPVEWEILDGVMVVAERENIVPGLYSTLRVRLAPGDYAMTCGLLTNPRGVLHVAESAEWTAQAGTVQLRDFLGALGEYKVYLIMQAGQAVAAAETLQQAIGAGDLAAAQAAWQAARAPYLHIEPLAARISDLANSINPQAAFLAGREADPGFLGYHRLEYGLFAQQSLDGLAPVAARLVDDLTALKERLSGFGITPALLVQLPADAARQLADSRIAQGETPYAGTDLDDIAASLDGIAKLSTLLGAILRPVDPALQAELETRLADAQAALDAMKGADGFPPYAQVDAGARKELAGAFARLADTLDRLQPVIGGV